MREITAGIVLTAGQPDVDERAGGRVEVSGVSPATLHSLSESAGTQRQG